MQANENDNPGVIAPAPLVFLPFIFIGLAVDYFWPIPLLPINIQYIAGGIIILLSFAPAIWVVRLFRQAGTNIDARKPVTQIVVSGPFRWSRNPVYLSMSMLVIGIGVAADSIWVVLFLVPATMITHYGIIRREEAYLERKFGDEYVSYKNKVRRWL